MISLRPFLPAWLSGYRLAVVLGLARVALAVGVPIGVMFHWLPNGSTERVASIADVLGIFALSVNDKRVARNKIARAAVDPTSPVAQAALKGL